MCKIDNINEFEKQKESEHICDYCSSYMIEIKKPKKNRYSKCNTIFRCPNCGHQFRKRTNNEILRDMGERE